MKPKLFLISGKARAGKTSLANMLKVAYNLPTMQLSYASYLKHLLREHYEWDGKKDSQGRELLQRIGTDVARKHNPMLWTSVVSNTLFAFRNEFDLFTIDDCRFVNEMNIPTFGCYDVYRVRVERVGYESELTEEQQLHESETALDDYKFDYSLQANNLKELLVQAIKMIGNIERRNK